MSARQPPPSPIPDTVFRRVRREADDVWGEWRGGAMEHAQRQQGLLKVCPVGSRVRAAVP